MNLLRLSAITALLMPLFGAPAYAADDPAGPALVARYTFDGGATDGRVNDLSGRGAALTIRGAANGQIAIASEGANRFASFPGICATGAATCAKALLEAPDDADLDPGVRNFKWAASVRVTKAQLSGNANIMQKGVAGTDSMWKMQVTGRAGRAQCVLVARVSGQTFSVLSARPVADGSWHRIACERTNGTLSISVDGVAGGRTPVPEAVAVDNMMPLRVGGPNLAGNGDMYHGQLDDVFVQLG
ncbi:LamG-like jellyroll fold domain-containing protein [Actinoplanes sp. NPDC026670]|uniref:LamG-like jellyroll fold domain-containing protein n=1 Tax=Actinoplanes sp. NPDC026670 TaxID=3154700 RepID=UPI0033F04CDF